MGTGRWMIYGASGFTGQLVTKLAVARGHKPILAGRNSQAVLDLSREMGLASDIFDLRDGARTQRRLQGMDLVLNCAGPFSQTASPLLAACLKTKTNYLDITGEIDVFEALFKRDQEFKSAGIAVLPGVGFDVVPTDTLAHLLHQKMPDATHLKLAFDPKGGQPSRGTALTALESLHLRTRVRHRGAITSLGPGVHEETIPFAGGPTTTVPIPWGDVSTAFKTTGIPNITVYLAVRAEELAQMQRLDPWRALLAVPLLRWLLRVYVRRKFRGPGDEARQRLRIELYGEASNSKGETTHLRMETPEGYHLTAESAVRAVEAVLAKPLSPGVHTPAIALGPEFCLALPGVRLMDEPMPLALAEAKPADLAFSPHSRHDLKIDS